jgi:hypothetical protein
MVLWLIPILFIFDLLLSRYLPVRAQQDDANAVPTIPNKSIYILWLQGIDQAPLLVKRCVHSWRHYNPDWNVILLNQSTLKDYLSYNEVLFLNQRSSLSPNHLSDIVRFMLLDRYGGVWADATTFCNRPLNDWLPYTIASHDAFFAFDRPTYDRKVSTWFLYAKAGGYIIREWKFISMQYHTVYSEAHSYFVHHYLFTAVYDADEEFKRCWDAVYKVDANNLGPHYLLELGYYSPISEDVKAIILSKITPLYKLNWRNFTELYQPDTLVDFLFNTIPFL